MNHRREAANSTAGRCLVGFNLGHGNLAGLLELVPRGLVCRTMGAALHIEQHHQRLFLEDLLRLL
jgi:hypothetical protein